ncbi:MAG TPA: carbohydrate binding domain-containing protein, partial [Gaiellales bacterium]|nr:carbohydrate binding domain-containing protein [Gaiellales bacterium]
MGRLRHLLLAGGVTGVVLLGAASVPAATNLIANGGFQGSGSGSLSGWAASGGTLSLVAGSGGGHAARVTPASGASQTYAYTSSKPAKSIVAGTAYTLVGWVRSDHPGASVCLKLKEVSGGSSTVGSAQQCVTVTSAWQQFPAVGYSAKTSGDSLTVNIAESSPAAGATFDIDDTSLTTGPADTAAPSVPQNVAASATGATSAHVAWDASSDDVGVAGYDVFRDGTKVKTVNGTSFDDTSLSAQTSYSYTVDAFDGAGNTSARSTAANVTTPAGGGGGGGDSGPCGLVPPSTRPYSHIVVIMEENLTVQAWQAAADAVYTHHLADDCRFESNAAGETHPSFPNYLAVASGTFEVCLACSSGADNIFHQADAAGLTWKGYNQSMPKNCA